MDVLNFWVLMEPNGIFSSKPTHVQWNVFPWSDACKSRRLIYEPMCLLQVTKGNVQMLTENPPITNKVE